MDRKRTFRVQLIASNRAHFNQFLLFPEQSAEDTEPFDWKVVSFSINICIYSSSEWGKEKDEFFKFIWVSSSSLKQDSSSWQKRLGRENEVSGLFFIVIHAHNQNLTNWARNEEENKGYIYEDYKWWDWGGTGI